MMLLEKPKINRHDKAFHIFTNVRLVVSDLDGTLLSSGKNIPSENLAAAEALYKAGIPLTINTGRPHQMVQAYAEQLNIDVPAICSNGAVLYNCKKKQIIDAIFLDKDIALQLLSFAAQISADYVVYTPCGVWFPPNSKRIERFKQYNLIAAESGNNQMEFFHLQANHDAALLQGVLKILVIEKSGTDLTRMAEKAGKLGGTDVVSPEADALEISHFSAGKGSGIHRLCEHLKIEPAQVCVFGDWHNDLSMFKEAGYSVAMHNAPLKVRQAATVVTTATNNKGGWADAVCRHILQK